MNLWKFLAAAAVLLALDAFDIRSCTMTPNLKAASALKVHLYDHCPYCTRVELVLGWHRRRYARKVYGYADVTGPMALTGKKVLPVITWRDEANMEHTLGESKDIIEAWNRHRSKFKLMSTICICIFNIYTQAFGQLPIPDSFSPINLFKVLISEFLTYCRSRNITQPLTMALFFEWHLPGSGSLCTSTLGWSAHGAKGFKGLAVTAARCYAWPHTAQTVADAHCRFCFRGRSIVSNVEVHGQRLWLPKSLG